MPCRKLFFALNEGMTNQAATLSILKIETPPATLREIALDRVRRAIISGLFEPGQRLVERTLCEQLGVSRSVIREVIRHLESEGLIEVIPKQGPIVARIGWDDARQIYDIRCALETAAVADCARQADERRKAELEAVLAELDRTSKTNSPPAILDATTEFYRLIFESSGHTIAWGIVTRLNSRISRLRVMTLSTANRTVSGPARMRQIFEAIKRNDPEAAMAACRDHVIEAARIAEDLLKAR